MADLFVDRYRATCTVTHDAQKRAKENESELKIIRCDADNLQHDVEVVSYKLSIFLFPQKLLNN